MTQQYLYIMAHSKLPVSSEFPHRECSLRQNLYTIRASMTTLPRRSGRYLSRLVLSSDLRQLIVRRRILIDI